MGMPAGIESESNELSLDKKNEEAEVDLTVEILAEVLRIFAARGRAIREAREKNGLGAFEYAESKTDQPSAGDA
ncbi:hypothetical protein ANRL3_02505 [Anaerolineae bacterium]|nr:hypothetical protein ANRL3_02505 [Anaerolineae bacterium]